MKPIIGSLLATVMCLALSSIASAGDDPADPTHPHKIDGSLFPGKIFTGDTIIHENLRDTVNNRDFTADDFPSFISSDKRLDIGAHRSDPVSYDISEGYGVDEFMFFLKGGVTLTSEDGTVTVIKPGDAVTVHKEWKGRWDSPEGYEKIYIIYNRDLKEAAE